MPTDTNADKTAVYSNFMDALRKQAVAGRKTETENGAVSYAEHVDPFVDFFYKLPGKRREDENAVYAEFMRCVADDPDLAMRLLFFVRDVRGGAGERRTFRAVYRALPASVVAKTMHLVPEYGRWDDLLYLVDNAVDGSVREMVSCYVAECFRGDMETLAAGRPVTLLAKWMPSIRNVSKRSVDLARRLARSMGMTEMEYRKALSALRKRIDVVERRMSTGDWNGIEYGKVPSKASLVYRHAFAKHSPDRYSKYLEGLKGGTEKANAAAVFPHEIVSAYGEGYGWNRLNPHADEFLEAQWKALPMPKGGILERAIVVRDGSASMLNPIPGSTRICAEDVADALSVLCAQNLGGAFANRFITFSRTPQYVDLTGAESLHDRLAILSSYDECSNTDIEATMDLILGTVVSCGMKQEDIPAIVIVSDMEFDVARGACRWENGPEKIDTLFETIAEKWKSAGYELPKIVFWNVNSRSNAVPMQENRNGLVLMGGFSQNLMDILSNGGSLREAVAKKLESERYDPVTEALSD